MSWEFGILAYMKDITKIIKLAFEGNKESIKYLQSIEKGLYIMVFKPSEAIYEIRKNPNKPHIIEGNTIVIKPGKFENGFFSRIRGGNGYNEVWKYKSNHEKAFLDNVKVYMMCDLTNSINKYVRVAEINFITIVKEILKVVKQEKSASEWLLSTEDVSEKDIIKIHKVLEEDIKHDCLSESKSKRFGLNKLFVK